MKRIALFSLALIATTSAHAAVTISEVRGQSWNSFLPPTPKLSTDERQMRFW